MVKGDESTERLDRPAPVPRSGRLSCNGSPARRRGPRASAGLAIGVHPATSRRMGASSGARRSALNQRGEPVAEQQSVEVRIDPSQGIRRRGVQPAPMLALARLGGGHGRAWLRGGCRKVRRLAGTAEASQWRSGPAGHGRRTPGARPARSTGRGNLLARPAGRRVGGTPGKPNRSATEHCRAAARGGRHARAVPKSRGAEISHLKPRSPACSRSSSARRPRRPAYRGRKPPINSSCQPGWRQAEVMASASPLLPGPPTTVRHATSTSRRAVALLALGQEGVRGSNGASTSTTCSTAATSGDPSRREAVRPGSATATGRPATDQPA